MRFIQFTKPVALIAAAIVAAPVHACPPPPPAPPPPPPPNVERLAGEDAEAHRLRISPLIAEHNRQLAAYSAERARIAAETASRIAEAERQMGAAQDAQFDKSRFVLAARVHGRTPLPAAPGTFLPQVDLDFQPDAMLKGKGRVGPIRYVARNGMLTSCGGYDPGVEGDPDGYVIFLDARRPGKIDPRVIVPMQWIRSPRIKALVAKARAAEASRKRR